MIASRTTTAAMIADTFTQRGLVWGSMSGERRGSAMGVSSAVGCPDLHDGGSLQDTMTMSISDVPRIVVMYTWSMPRLWTDTIAAHRHQVRDAILDTTAALVAEHGLLQVTMSQIAEQTGIGRATLYKYFPDVEAILLAWHERHVAGHLQRLAEVRDQAGGAGERLEAVLEAYALISHYRQQHGAELAGLLHRHDRVAPAQRQLRDLLRDLLAEAAASGEVRDDVAPEELASYCLHALAGAGSLPSRAAVRRLVAVTLAGVRAQR
jgi:AcrR family transcriptional regulator